MLCERCGEQTAVINLTSVQDERVWQEHLCAACAAARGLQEPPEAPPRTAPTPAAPQATAQAAAVQQLIAAARVVRGNRAAGESDALATAVRRLHEVLARLPASQRAGFLEMLTSGEGPPGDRPGSV